MSAEHDMAQYLDLFLQEADEQLEILEQETLKLEQDPSKERLQIIFRAAHTLKGSSRAMGFTHFAELTHQMENVLDLLRNDQLQVTTPIADALLGCLDSLREMKDQAAEGKSDASDCSELIERLAGFASAEVSTPEPTPFLSRLTEDQRDALKASVEAGATIYHGRFRLTPDCVMKFVRAFMVVSAIQEAGELLVSVPEREALEDEQFGQEFEAYFSYTGSLADLQAKIAGISEMEPACIVTWTPTEAPAVIAEVRAAKPIAKSTSSEPKASAPAGDPARKGDTGQTVRVDVARLDNLMNLVGELVIDRTRIAQIGANLSAKYNDGNVDALAETVGHIARITGDLQDQIMKARMMPIETVFNRFPRVVRDLANKLGKDVKLDLHGGETELDRSVIEVIGDPLLHILRNSVDHGLELPDDRVESGKSAQGHITVGARHQENHIVIEIIDDGRGIDVERVKKKAIESGLLTKDAAERMTDRDALQLIFASGLSTAPEVSEVSGRGVGMDIVRSNIQKLGGLIDVETTPGEGTKFSLRLPLTLAIIRGLLVDVNDVVYVIPLGSVVETLLVETRQIQRVNRREVIVIREQTTPLIRLRQVFVPGDRPASVEQGSIYVVIVGTAEQRAGLVVDSLIGEQEVVIKSLSRFCGDVRGVSGATILGDGNVALILDVNAIVAGGS